MPFFIFEPLRKIVGPLQLKYPSHQPTAKNIVIAREHGQGDFACLVRFVANEKIKVKPGTYDITKSKLIKMSQSIGIDEIYDNDGFFGNGRDTSRSSDCKIGLPMFLLAANSGLLDIDAEGVVSPGKGSVPLLSLSPHRLAKALFDDYMNKNKVYELHFIPYINIYDGYWAVPWHECRKDVMASLKKVPVDKWVAYKDFNKYTGILYRNFFRKYLNCAIYVSGFNFGYGYYGNYTPDWNECESQLLQLMLSFLCALGMVDVAYREKTLRIAYGNKDFCVGIESFRITPLGAWILGLTDTYDATTPQTHEDGRLMVLPDYSIIISGLKKRIEHETFLSPFLTKVSDDAHVSTFKLDFASALRAYGMGITPSQIQKYLEKASETPLPDNILRTLSDWQAKTQRVRIKTVTILETDDPLLLAELKHLRSMDQMTGEDIQHAVVVKGMEQKKVKTLIEKNGWFVRWDPEPKKPKRK